MGVKELITKKTKFIITLPFDFGPVSNCQATLEALEWTHGGWSWYVEAQDLQDVQTGEKLCLGTLGYLPLEILQRVYGMVLDDDYHTVFDNDPTLDRHQRELGEFGFTDCSQPQQALEDYRNGCFYYQPLPDINKYYDLWEPKTYTPFVATEPMNHLNLRQVSRNT